MTLLETARSVATRLDECWQRSELGSEARREFARLHNELKAAVQEEEARLSERGSIKHHLTDEEVNLWLAVLRAHFTTHDTVAFLAHESGLRVVDLLEDGSTREELPRYRILWTGLPDSVEKLEKAINELARLGYRFVYPIDLGYTEAVILMEREDDIHV